MNYRELQLEDADAASIAPFGELLGVGHGRPTTRTRFYDDAVELVEKAPFRSDADTCLSIARIHRPLVLHATYVPAIRSRFA